MVTIEKKCSCAETTVKLGLAPELDMNSVAGVHCPECAQDIPDGYLVVKVEGGELNGLWAFQFNAALLEERDQYFEDRAEYYVEFWESGKVGFVDNAGKVRVVGVKGASGVSQEEYLSEKEKRTSDKPSKLPKDRLQRPDESYRPLKRD